MRKFGMIVAVLATCCVLSACGRSASKTQIVTFDAYRMTIPADYREVSSSLIENKQILNKVLKSFKKDEERQFASNLVVTKAEVAPELDYEQFYTANTSKLSSFMVGYKANDKRVLNFPCNDEEIKGVYVSFGIENSFLGKGGPYQFAQFQFIHNEAGFIISTATSVAEEQDDLLNYLETLACF